MNAAYDPAFKSYQLSAVPNIQAPVIEIGLIPKKVSDDVFTHFKEEFGRWIIGSGLREVIERFAVFLDGVHYTCQWIAVNKQTLQPAEAEKRHKVFQLKGVQYKLCRLQEHFAITPRYPDYIVSINQARHCLTHRIGKVAPEDSRGTSALDVKWAGMNLQVELESGEVIPIEKRKPEIVIQGLGTLQLKYAERCKSFPLGAFVTFEKHELEEICRFMLDGIQQVTQSAIEYARSQGIEFQPKDSPAVERENP